MVRRKRSYVPKIKGCYECSHRRIDCDRTEPGCKKCSSKGIECSGFGTGIKYRFRDGFAPGRKNARKPRQGSDEFGGAAFQVSFASPPAPSSAPQGTDHHVRARHDSWPSSDADFSQWSEEVASLINFIDDSHHDGDPRGGVFWGDLSPVDTTLGLSQQSSWESTYDEAFFFGRGEDLQSQSPKNGINQGLSKDTSTSVISHDLKSAISNRSGTSSSDSDSEPDEIEPNAYQQLTLRASLNPIDAWNRYLLKHFCDKIAPQMVVLDSVHNGWRHLVLPIAVKDDLVMSSVLAASAFHITGDSSPGVHLLSNPRTLYAHAIRKLQCRRELDGCDQETRQTVILSIIVLLVVVMINGCSDFPVMFRMLQSAVDAIGGDNELEKGDELALFCLRQIRKMRVYAAPLLSQQDGLHAIISSQVSQSSDCIRLHQRLYPEYANVFDTLEDLRHQAFNIYLDQILPSKSPSLDSEDAVEHFIQTVQSYPADSPGQHALVWPCFIAASASKDQAHRDFFQQFITQQYEYNGFANLLRAIELLQKIWTREETEQDWPALLPEPKVFIM